MYGISMYIYVCMSIYTGIHTYMYILRRISILIKINFQFSTDVFISKIIIFLILQ